MGLFEPRLRRDSWIEGTWIMLADGQAWCFPPHDSIPGHQAKAQQAAREIVDSLTRLTNIGLIKRQCDAIDQGNISGILSTVRRMLGVYQVGYQIAQDMLIRNYDISEADCERLMPFNYKIEQISDPASNLNTATPQLLAIYNQIAAILGIDIVTEFNRISQNN